MRFEIRKAIVNNEELAYHIYNEDNEAVPLIMIMGYGCTMDMWPLIMIEKLSAERPVIIFDNKGMGYSTGNGEYSIENFAADAAALLDYLKIEKAHVFGWSMGAYTALQLAVTYPEKIEKLIVHAGMCGGDEEIKPDPEIWEGLTDMSGTVEERVARMFANLFPADWFAQNPDPSKYFPPVFEPVNNGSIEKQAEVFNKWNGIFEQLKYISSEALLVTGDSDVIVPPANSFLIAREMKIASVIKIRNGGHGVMYQFPDLISDYVNIFLKY